MARKKRRGLEELMDEIERHLFTLKTRNTSSGIDPELFERTVFELYELKDQLMIAKQLVEVLSSKLKAHELILQHFNADDIRIMRQRIQARVSREDGERSGDPVQEVYDLRAN